MHCEMTASHLHDPDSSSCCDSDYDLGCDALNHGPYPSRVLSHGNHHRDVLTARSDHGSGYDSDCGSGNALCTDHRPYWTSDA